jgi:hypothetical protein
MVALILIYLFQPIQTDLRALMDQAYLNENNAVELMNSLEKKLSLNPLEKAYKGTLYMLQADRAYFPWMKYKHFRSGAGLLDEACEQDPKNLEVRYLRFASQTNAPSFLGYDEYLNVDKQVLFLGLPKLNDQDLEKRIKTLLLASKHVTEDEKRIIK